MTAELPSYTRFIHDFNRFVDRHTGAPSGYCSWYYYMDNIDERMVYENLETIDEIRDRVHLKVFQIDAGWAEGNHNGRRMRSASPGDEILCRPDPLPRTDPRDLAVTFQL